MAWIGIDTAKSKNRLCKKCRKNFQVGESLLNITASGNRFPTSVNICWDCLVKLSEEILYLNCKED